MRSNLAAVVLSLVFCQVAVGANQFDPVSNLGRVVYIPKSLFRPARIFQIMEAGGEGSRLIFDQNYHAYDFRRDFRGAVALEELKSDMYFVESIDIRSDLKGLHVRKIARQFIDYRDHQIVGYEVDGKIMFASELDSKHGQFIRQEELLSMMTRLSGFTHFSDGTLLGLLADTSAAGRESLGQIITAMNAGVNSPPANFLRFEAAILSSTDNSLVKLQNKIRFRGDIDKEALPINVVGKSSDSFEAIFNRGRVVFTPKSERIFRITDFGGEGSRNVFDQDYRAYDFQRDFVGAIVLDEQQINKYLVVKKSIRSDLIGYDVKRITKAFSDPSTKQLVGYEMDGKYVLTSQILYSESAIVTTEVLTNLIMGYRIVNFSDEALLGLLADKTLRGRADLKKIVVAMNSNSQAPSRNFLRFEAALLAVAPGPVGSISQSLLDGIRFRSEIDAEMGNESLEKGCNSDLERHG